MENTLTTVYKSRVTEIGSEVQLFLTEKMLIIFNETAPADLKSIGVIHEETELLQDIEAGDTLILGGNSFKISFVGGKANQTIRELGHCTLAFNGETSADLPGTICVEDKPIPELLEGIELVFIKE
ncbi:PTS glucitol/sorbitol transporter subunit IIA [Neobacillus sp. LXY-4]|uniref:PTS glucitol/sorbitol transporter subunit IIA n=1 Tax=Neobacillus sp. LXY-4 TaxID=3379826 RepID=UPI003EE2CC40